MRFALAAALLAQSLPTTCESRKSSKDYSTKYFSNKLESGEQIFDTVLENQGEPRGRFLNLLKEKKEKYSGFQFQNFQKAVGGLHEHECNPESGDADVGVLSCGVGRYCVESDESTMGGLCVASTAEEEEEDRVLQAEQFNLFDGLYRVFCDPTAPYSADCNCTGIDSEAYTLEVSCSRAENCTQYISICGENTTSCINYGFNFNLSGPGMYVVDRCFEDRLPYYQKTCYHILSYGSGVAEGCVISVNDDDCFSCAIDTTAGGGNCYQFDCTNTISKRAGDLCVQGVYVAPILNYLRTYGCDLYTCPICGGDDFVATNPGGLIDLGDGQTSCAAVAQVALLGGFDETFCQDVVIPGVVAPCGCVAFGSPPVEVSTTAPVAITDTRSPSLEETSIPSISPVLVTFPPESVPPTSGALRNAAVGLVGLVLIAFLQSF
jgi:hypothetical protein